MSWGFYIFGIVVIIFAVLVIVAVERRDTACAARGGIIIKGAYGNLCVKKDSIIILE